VGGGIGGGVPVGDFASGGAARIDVNARAFGHGRNLARGVDHICVGHGVGAALAVGGPGNRDRNDVGGASEDFGNAAGIGEAAGNTDDQISVGRAAADVAVDVIVPGKLVLVIAGGVSGGRKFILLIRRA